MLHTRMACHSVHRLSLFSDCSLLFACGASVVKPGAAILLALETSCFWLDALKESRLSPCLTLFVDCDRLGRAAGQHRLISSSVGVVHLNLNVLIRVLDPEKLPNEIPQVSGDAMGDGEDASHSKSVLAGRNVKLDA